MAFVYIYTARARRPQTRRFPSLAKASTEPDLEETVFSRPPPCLGSLIKTDAQSCTALKGKGVILGNGGAGLSSRHVDAEAGGLRKFEACLGYTVRLHLKKQIKTKSNKGDEQSGSPRRSYPEMKREREQREEKGNCDVITRGSRNTAVASRLAWPFLEV